MSGVRHALTLTQCRSQHPSAVAVGFGLHCEVRHYPRVSHEQSTSRHRRVSGIGSMCESIASWMTSGRESRARRRILAGLEWTSTR